MCDEFQGGMVFLPWTRGSYMSVSYHFNSSEERSLGIRIFHIYDFELDFSRFGTNDLVDAFTTRRRWFLRLWVIATRCIFSHRMIPFSLNGSDSGEG